MLYEVITSASAPDLELTVHDGRLSVAAGRQPLLAAENIDLQLALSAKDPRSLRATLAGAVAEVTIRRNGRQETIKGVITSYSIHYTKLYDRRGHQEGSLDGPGTTLPRAYRNHARSCRCREKGGSYNFV